MRRTRNYFSHMHLLILSLALVIALAVQIGYTPQVRAQVITDVIELGDTGGGVAVNSETNRVYVAVVGKINVYDAPTHGLITTITLPQNYTACLDVAVNSLTNLVYAEGYKRTYVIDGNTNKVLANLDKSGEEIAVNSATNRIYISERSGYPYTYVVHVLDGVNNTWLTDILVGTSTSYSDLPHVAANPTTNRVYIAFGGDDDLRVLDGSTHAETTRIHLENIGYVAVNPDTNRVYAGKNSTDVAVLDGVTHTELGTITNVGKQMQVNRLTHRLYGLDDATPGYILRVADLDTNHVVGYVYLDGNWADFDIHLSLGKLFGVDGTYPDSWSKKMTIIQDASPTRPEPKPSPPVEIATLDLPRAASGIAVNTLTNRLYVGVNGGISIYDATTLDSLSYIPLYNPPDNVPVYDIGVDEARNRIYAITSVGTYAVNGMNNQVLAKWLSGNEIAVNPNNGRVYVAYRSIYVGVADVVRIYDGAGLSLIRTINLGIAHYIESVHVAVNPTTGYAYCTYSEDGDLRIISPVTDDITQTIDYPTSGYLTVNPLTNRVYMWTVRDKQDVALILDGNTHTELGMVKGVTGKLKINPLTNRLYGYTGSTLFTSFDGNSGAMLSRIFLDGGISNYAIHPGLSRLYVIHGYSPAEWANKVSVIQDSIQPMGKVLTVNLSGTGKGRLTSSPAGIDCGTTCSYPFPDITVVSLSATPAFGSTFSGWSGSGCSGLDSCTVTMDMDKSVTAEFTYMGTNTISGNVGAAGVTLHYADGLPRTTKSDSNGDYMFTITSSWSGTITPVDLCFDFSPPYRSFTNVLTDMIGQDFMATPKLCYRNYVPLIIH